MSTVNQQCRYCYQTTSVRTFDDGSDAYEYEANGNCGCEDRRRAVEDRAFDDDD